MDKTQATFFIVLAIAVVALVAVVVILWPGEGPDQVGTDLEKREEIADQEKPSSGEEAALPLEPIGEETAREGLEPTGIFISGRVVNMKTGEPVHDYKFELQRLDEEKWIDAINEKVRDEEGQFQFSLESGGKHRLSLSARQYIPRTKIDVDVPMASGLNDLVFEIDPGLGVTGRVVDDATSAPVAGALVVPVTHTSSVVFGSHLFGSDTNVLTDERGCFDLRALTGDFKTIAAVHPDYAEGTAVVDFKRDVDVQIRLKAGAYIFGKAFNDWGEPVVGLVISMSGDSTPLARAVLTLPDGSFKLPPASPGTVNVTAEPPPDTTEEVVGFTEETKSIALMDQDVEIFFGPSPNHVTWRGRLFDYEGEPVPGGRLIVTPVRPVFYIYGKTDESREVRCRDDGEFEVRKLVPDDYAVTLRLADRVTKLDWDTVTFENSGVVVRDIRIKGGVIEGVVVDSLTGSPLVGKGGLVFTNSSLRGFRAFSTGIDENGRFVLQGLPSARYQLDARVRGFPPAKSEWLELDEDGRIENVSVPVFLGGKWILKFTGFLKSDPRDCVVNWSRDGSRGWHSTTRIDESGEKETTREVETGKWIMKVKFEGWGVVEREFEILPGEETETVIQRDDVDVGTGLANVNVLLKWTDGSPVGGAKVQFFYHDMTSGGPGERYIFGTTDPTGRIDLTGFRPGEWRVLIVMPYGGQAELPRTTIPENASNPFVLNLVLPMGQVTGTFHDAMTGKNFGGDLPVWWIHVYDVQQRKNITSIQGGKGSRFRLAGMVGGEYKLYLKARGYADRETEIFRLAKGESLDLGRIDMEPMGILDLEVVDLSGSPIEQYNLTCSKYARRSGFSEFLSPSRRRHFSFPFGAVAIKIEAEGFRDQEFEVHFEPGQPAKVRIVLESE